jgi:sortase A
MLSINGKKSVRRAPRKILVVASVLLIAGGLYTLALVFAPAAAPYLVTKPITVSALPAPKTTDNRIIIPKIGVNIPYNAGGKAALDQGAEWRYPERGNPAKGGNFIIAAHRFTIQPTIGGTIEKSPFYNIDKLVTGDKIVVDYDGVRYGYEITSLSTVKPDQTEIEAPSDTAKLTLYSCELDGSDAGRVVIVAGPLGKIALGVDTTPTE